MKNKANLTKKDIVEYIKSQDNLVDKKEIYKAFKLKGSDKIWLKKILKDLQKEGVLKKGKGKKFMPADALPKYIPSKVMRIDENGELIAVPLDYLETSSQVKFEIIITDEKKLRGGALKVGDKVLLMLKNTKFEKQKEAVAVRKIMTSAKEVYGIFRRDEKGGYVVSSKKSEKFVFRVRNAESAKAGDIIRAETLPSRYGKNVLDIQEVICKNDDPKALSLVGVFEHELPYYFPDNVIEEAQKLKNADYKDRKDLTKTKLVTIDGIDAKDFDDAVFAKKNDDSNFEIIVAIADIAHYVKEDSKLDKQAYKRGNSVYLPDMVIPMLPNELSTDLCSLKPMQERPVLAVHMTIDENGNKLSYKFERAMIKSHARLTYSQVQNAYEGITDGLTKPLLNDVINPLYEAYHALKKARKRRKTLEIDVPEKKVYVNENGIVEKISPRERYESHKLIEEFMILANVCAAEEIEKHEKYNGVYRIHDIPSKSKIDNLCETLKTLGIKAISGETFKADFYNKIMEKAEDKPYEFVVKNLVLRSQSQAEYSPDNIGHFGLSLEKYTHFTSPIRRYADLCVHRLLIQCLGLGEGGMSVEANKKLYNICEHISQCERDAMVVERETVDRYVAQYLTDKINATFKARVNGVSRAGLFITLNETGADGLIPMSSLPDDYYVYQEDKHLLYGQASGRSFSIGDELKAELIEIRPIAGGLIFKYLDEKKGANYQSKEDSSNKGRRRKKRRKK